MRNKIFGAIGVIWGSLILLHRLLGGASQTSVQSQAFRDGYSVGQNLSVVFGALLVVVGLYYFFRKPKQG
jgi:hypothetical protein